MDGEAEAAPDSDNTPNTFAARMAPVEVRQEAGTKPGNALSGHAPYEEVRCAVCSKPLPTIRCPKIEQNHTVVRCTNGERYASTCCAISPALASSS